MINNLIVDICNGAIRKSGQDGRIVSIDENTNMADLCKDIWDSAIRFIYSIHPWAFKKIRAQADLQTLSDDPIATQGQNIFGYPDNALRILGFFKDKEYLYRVSDARVSSDINGKKVILSNEEILFIEFLLTETANDNISPWLREVLELKIAIEIARTKGRDIRILSQEFQAMLDTAQENNASETSVEIIDNDDYINIRG
jgi:hypothetical protein